jgi:hypothetical protein
VKHWKKILFYILLILFHYTPISLTLMLFCLLSLINDQYFEYTKSDCKLIVTEWFQVYSTVVYHMCTTRSIEGEDLYCQLVGNRVKIKRRGLIWGLFGKFELDLYSLQNAKLTACKVQIWTRNIGNIRFLSTQLTKLSQSLIQLNKTFCKTIIFIPPRIHSKRYKGKFIIHWSNTKNVNGRATNRYNLILKSRLSQFPKNFQITIRAQNNTH